MNFFRCQLGAVAESHFDKEDHQGSNTALVRLSQGDAVWVSLSNGNDVHGRSDERTISFSGVLLAEDIQPIIVGK